MIKVTYFGIPGSYSFIAAKSYFKNKAELVGCRTIAEVIKKVSKKEIDFGVIPLENSLTGSISEATDGLLSSDLFITAELILHIHHCLLGKNGINPGTVYSHPQAFTQCADFFNRHSKLIPEYTSDTATAAKLVSDKALTGAAALGSRINARIYNLDILQENIEDNSRNFTRFAVISARENKTGNKITLFFSVAHRPGSLISVLSPYARLGLNLTKIESRPVFGKPWEYIFFLDFETGGNTDVLKKLMLEMKKYVNFIRLIGIYDRGKTYET